MMTESIYIILEQFKRGNLSEKEVATLIEDLYSNKQSTTIPYWPQITYTYEESETLPDYSKVICNVNK